jgi:hypothetical protein
VHVSAAPIAWGALTPLLAQTGQSEEIHSSDEWECPSLILSCCRFDGHQV